MGVGQHPPLPAGPKRQSQGGLLGAVDAFEGDIVCMNPGDVIVGAAIGAATALLVVTIATIARIARRARTGRAPIHEADRDTGDT